MRASDFIVDIGPGAGVHGGEVIVAGTPQEVMDCKKSITGQYLSGRLKIDVPKKRRKGNGNFIQVKGAAANNLKNINVKFPLGCMSVVTGLFFRAINSCHHCFTHDFIYKSTFTTTRNPCNHRHTP